MQTARSSCEALMRIAAWGSCFHFIPSMLVYFLTMMACSLDLAMVLGERT